MKIEQLRRVLEVYNTGSINRAAQNLYMSQSSLSSSINALEMELGEKIFKRSAEGVVLTSFGGQFVEHTREILNHVDTIERLCAIGPQKPVSSRLDVMVYYLFFAQQVWAIFCNSHRSENIDLNYLERTRTEIINSVANGKAELGLLMMPSVDREKWLSLMAAQGLEYTLISIETPHAVMGPYCEMYDSSALTPAQLANRKMIIFPEENDLFMTIDRKIFKKFSPNSFLTVCDRGSLIGILNQTEAYYLGTFNKKAYSHFPFYGGVKCIPILGTDFHYEIGYVRRRGMYLSAYADEFMQMIQMLLA